MAPLNDVGVPDGGWIDVPVCETVLTKELKFLVCIDGSDESLAALDYLADDVLLRDRTATVEALHIYNDEKVGLPHKFRKDFLESRVDGKLASSVSAKRYKLSWRRKTGSCAMTINERIVDFHPAFVCMGFTGRKGRKDTAMVASNVWDVMRAGKCSAIIFKDCSVDELPIRRITRFVVSVSLNTASTKAFLDALRLSKPGDEIHVVYVKGYMENVGEDSDYTQRLRDKYHNFFDGLQDGSQEIFKRFHDRQVEFHFISKKRSETTPQAVVRYADGIDADFLVIGFNPLEKIKTPLGCVSMQIAMETERNIVVSTWIDVDPRIYDDHVRPVSRS